MTGADLATSTVDAGAPLPGCQPAPLLARLAAALLDGAFGIAVVAYVVPDASGRRPWLGAMRTARGGLGVWCGIGWIYTVFFERTACIQATPGKVVMNVRVDSVDGGQVGVYAAALRNALRLADLQPCLCYLVGAISALRSPLRQRLGDRAARTVVARHRFPSAGRLVCLVVLTTPVTTLLFSYRRRRRD